MRKSILFLFALAICTMITTTSCSKEEKVIKEIDNNNNNNNNGNNNSELTCPNSAVEREALYVGNYSGEAILNVNVLGTQVSVPVASLFKINNGTAGDDKIVITSNLLENNSFEIEGLIHSGDCKKFSIGLTTKSTLEFTNMPASLAGGVIKDYRPLKINNFSAEGSGALQNDGKTLKITLNILSGTTSSPNNVLDGIDVANNTLELRLVLDNNNNNNGNNNSELTCPNSAVEREALYVGNYSGEAILNVNVLGAPVSVPVASLFKINNGTAGDDKIIITSNLLENYSFEIEGLIHSGDCKKFSIGLTTKSTLEFTNMPASLAGSLITNYRPLKINNFSAEGSGVLQNDGKTLKITLNILSGTTSSPNSILDGLDVANNTLELRLVKV